MGRNSLARLAVSAAETSPPNRPPRTRRIKSGSHRVIGFHAPVKSRSRYIGSGKNRSFLKNLNARESEVAALGVSGYEGAWQVASHPPRAAPISRLPGRAMVHHLGPSVKLL